MSISGPRHVTGDELKAITDKIYQDQAATFIHVPKTAGTSITNWARSLYTSPHKIMLVNRSHRHVHDVSYQAVDVVKEKQPIIFSVVRNPYDWLASMTRHSFESNGWRDINECTGYPATYSEFLERFFNHEVDFVGSNDNWNNWCWKSLTSSGNKKTIDLNCTKHEYWCFREFSFWQTFDILNTPGPKVNHAHVYIRYEYLKEGLTMLFGNIANKLPWRNKSPGKSEGYKSMYNTETKNMVAHFKESELQLFGYDFDGPTDDCPLIVPTAPYIKKR